MGASARDGSSAGPGALIASFGRCSFDVHGFTVAEPKHRVQIFYQTPSRKLETWTVKLRGLILHFTSPIVQTHTRGGLLLEGEQGTSAAVRPDLLAQLLAITSRDVPLRCVVLNACFTAAQAEAIAAHVDCVVGASRAIEDLVVLRE